MNILRAICIVIFAMPLLPALAGPEKFDHMAAYKQARVQYKGPDIEKVYNEAGKLTASAKYKYNDKNQLVRADFSGSGNSDGHITYKYKQGRLFEERVHDASGKLIERLEYETNSHGQVLSYKVFNDSRKLQLRWSFSYAGSQLTGGSRFINRKRTESFRMVGGKSSRSQLIFSAANEQVGKVRYEYKRKQLQERIVTNTTGYRKVTYEYDKNGRISEMKFFKQTHEGLKLVKKHSLEYSFSLQAKTGFKS